MSLTEMEFTEEQKEILSKLNKDIVLKVGIVGVENEIIKITKDGKVEKVQ